MDARAKGGSSRTPVDTVGAAGDDKASTQDLARLVEDSLNEIYVFHIDSLLFLNVNRSARENLGYSMEELRAMTPVDIKPFYEMDEFDSLLVPLRNDGTKKLLFETVHRRKNGTDYPVEVHLQTGEYGRQRVCTAIILDITERKRAEEEKAAFDLHLQHAQKLESLGILAGGIAHDFNNILGGILGYADLARLSAEPGSDTLRYVEDLVNGARRGSELINQMLAYSGKGKFLVEPVDLEEVVEDMCSLIQVSISKKCTIEYNFSGALPRVDADAAQINQVVLNLVVNACEAIGDDAGLVSITSGTAHYDANYLADTFRGPELPEGDYVFLEVSDSGSGIDEKIMSKIFDPFFTTKFTGRGLGLAAILGIVKGHNGALKVHSEPGKGTTFKVIFPVSAEAAPLKKPVAAASREISIQGLALIIDDEPLIRELASEMLKKIGFETICASDGEEGCKLFDEHQSSISLVLLDLTMPKIDGAETFSRIRKTNANIPTILMSGYSEHTAINQFVGKGLAGFLQKPFAYDGLLDVVTGALND